MKTNASFLKYSLIFSALLSSGSALSATQEGDVLMRVRIIDINPQNSGTLIVKDSVSLDIDFTYMVSDHFGVELLLDTSSEHNIQLDGADVVVTKVLPPALIAQYHVSPSEKVRPYIGIGINYTLFFDEKTTGSVSGLDVELDSSTGMVFQAGVDFDINDKWFANIDFKKMEINTIARLTGGLNIDSNLDPVVIGVGVGMKF